MDRVAANLSYGLDKLDIDADIEHMASIPQYNPNPVIEFDKKGKTILANDAAHNALTAIGTDDDIKKFMPEDFKKIIKLLDSKNPDTIVSREVTIEDRVFSETVHPAKAFGTIRIYAIDITERIKAETVLAQQQEELKQSYGVIRRSLDGTVNAVAAVAEHKDPYTAGHERRVRGLSVVIGREMGLDDSTLEGLKIAATLHDVGKIYIPAEILSKPRVLNDLEFSMIKEHPKYSYEILSNIDFPWPIADIALQHHERVDGSGYPAGLKGKDILVEAKILAVADVIEAMSSHRPYRAALTIEQALDEIKKGRGKIFDSKAADAALKIFKDGYEL